MSTQSSHVGWWLRDGKPKSGFRYVGAGGRPLTAARTIERIESLVIPPGWVDVHISPDPARKVQAWGYDKAGRKQYIYSPHHIEARDRRKWQRVLRVARALPVLREATNEHLRRDRLDRQKVMATVVRLICRAGFRAGSERYAVHNRTFGICTLGKQHVRIEGRNLIFSYVGKRRKDQRQVVADTPLVDIIADLVRLPGRRLFQYPVRPSRPRRRKVFRPVTAQSVNRYLYEILGERYTSKDLRTFGGTVRAATILADLDSPATSAEARRNVKLALNLVAHELGNTPSICRKAYIHPAVLAEYEAAGRTVANLPPARRSGPRVAVVEPVGHYPEELALMRFLERYG